MFICDISVFNKYGKQRLDEMLMPLNMNWRELVVILVIEKVPGIDQAQLIPFLQTHKGNVTRLLHMMEEKRWIRRETNDRDQRNKLCFLTNQGEGLTPALHKILIIWESKCFREIDQEEIKEFRRIGKKISENLLKGW